MMRGALDETVRKPNDDEEEEKMLTLEVFMICCTKYMSLQRFIIMATYISTT